MIKIFSDIPLLFFDFSGGEFMLVVFAFLMLFGPKKIPEIARTFGKAMAELRRATEDVKREIMSADMEKEVIDAKNTLNSLKTDILENPVLKELEKTKDNLINQSNFSPNNFSPNNFSPNNSTSANPATPNNPATTIPTPTSTSN